MRRKSISLIAAAAIVAATAIVSALPAPAGAAEAPWPPKGSPVRVPVVRDNWTSAVGEERYGNNGGSSRMKLKGQQEHSIFDIDPSALRGKLITGVLWHVRSAGVREPLRRVTVSTLASPWVEGAGTQYSRQAGSSCFAQAELGKRDWSYPGSTLMDVAFGGGRTIWRFAEASPPAVQGWQAVAIDPDVLAARVAGLSHGLAAYDDVGSEWSYRGGKFTYFTFPNRFIFSREQSSSAPWLEVWVNGTDSTPPAPVTDIAATTQDLPDGETLVTWTTPADTGGGKTLGFNVAFAAANPSAAKAGGQVPRYLIPFAGPAGKQVRMHLAGLPLPPGGNVTLTICAVDSAGNVGPAASKAIRVSAEPAAMELPEAGIEPFAPSMDLPAAGPLKVAVVDLMDKISPSGGAMIPPQPQGYLGGNHLWSAAKKLVRLYAARNEAVCFQVNLAGSARAARAALTFPASAGVKAKVERFDYVATSAGVLPDVIVPLPAGGRFAVPFADDPEAAGAKNVSLLCEAYVPHDAKPGPCRGTLAIEADGGTLDIAVELNVWDFTLPDKLSFIPEMNCYGTADPEKGLEYYRVAHEHRLCINRLYYNWRGQPSAAPRWAGGAFDWAAWDKAFGPLLDGSAFAGLPRAGEPVDVFYLPLCENWPVPIEKNYLKTYWIDRAFRPEYRQELSKAFAEFARHCDQRKWHQTIFEFYLNNKVYFKRDGGWARSSALWVFDEPVNTQDFWALRWYGAAWQEAVAGPAGAAKMWFRADVSYSQYERDIFRDVLDIECLGGCDEQKVRMARERSLLGGGGCHVQYGSANDPAAANLQPALWCLKAFSDGSVGVLPWQTIGAADKLTKGAPTGLFIAAPGGGVVPSVRVKAFRRGQQDVEYLTMLGSVSGKPLFAVAGMLKKRIDLSGAVRKASEADAGTADFGKASPAAMWRLRVAAGAAISARHPPYRRCIRPITVPKRDPGALDMPRYASPAPPLPPSGPDM
jgi:hypothetical protein